MAPYAVGRGRVGVINVRILPDPGTVVVVMVVEIAGMALNTGAAITAVDRGIAIAVEANNAGAVDNRVALEAIVLVDRADDVAKVAVDAEGSSSKF